MRQATVTSTAMSLPSTVLNSMSSVRPFSPSAFALIRRFCSFVSKVSQSVENGGKKKYVAPGAYVSGCTPREPINVNFRVSTPTSFASVEWHAHPCTTGSASSTNNPSIRKSMRFMALTSPSHRSAGAPR